MSVKGPVPGLTRDPKFYIHCRNVARRFEIPHAGSSTLYL